MRFNGEKTLLLFRTIMQLYAANSMPTCGLYSADSGKTYFGTFIYSWVMLHLNISETRVIDQLSRCIYDCSDDI